MRYLGIGANFGPILFHFSLDFGPATLYIIDTPNTEGNMKAYDVTGNIIAYESGELTHTEVIRLFSHLIKNGMAWTLQGCYGRMAVSLIEAGYLSPKGVILQ